MKHFTPENFHAGLMGLLIGRVDSLKNRILDTHLVPYGVTSSQFKVLIIVGQFGSDTPVELCRHLSLDSGSMTRMIDRLEQKELLVRIRSETDRRQVKLALTEEGQKLAGLLPMIGSDAMNDLFSSLDTVEVKNLEQILTKMLVAADDQITIARLGFNQVGAK
ncbi:MAG: MarR family transcriptional regulator [Pseudomonas sp.]|jgi:DNA-binding MarR family transcriptional regulator|uniref:MarR family winged helix-turn-helix transcriptional regulator n=1 Tax=Pseudomonas sp. TaxID=306 RepID=UPI0026261D2A|nr:MarR family transcriptional regulator [Pseudomonas sp.]MDB6048859.1 MarR family transcriptional regulator [Pseudomonas sp.]